jgi:DNA mismatch repair protein MutL
MSAAVQRLDALTVSRIAAGEVIERPASVVKELLDNALDAGSSRIDIDLHNGGRQLIQVTDNGLGMTPADAVLALQRFTTSKIRRLEDLQTLTTLGFRGEALPSIAAVARVDVYTRVAASSEGVLVSSQEDGEPRVQPIGCPVGTRVCVQQLFAHLPVRLRALKSIAREVQQIQDLVAWYALAHPQVTLHLRHDGRRLLFAPANADPQSRLSLVLGREVAAHMLPLHWQSIDMHIVGAISTPALTRATRQRQYFWVNGRPVYSGLLSIAVERAYGALLPPGRHPVVGLGVSVPPELLDINIHPRKTEVKFLHERAVFAAFQDAVAMVLQRLPDTVEPAVVTADAWEGLAPPVVQEGRAEYRPRLPATSAPLQALGQVGNTFLVASGAQGLLVLDQHAAHECLLYAELLAAAGARVEVPETFVCHLTTAQYRWCESIWPALESLGFLLEPFGKDTLLVRMVPAALQAGLRPAGFLEAIEEARSRLTPRASVEDLRDQLSAALACRTAWRAGDPLAAPQIAMLVEAMAQQRLPYTCPHGRPTFLTLSLAELERRFLRFFPLDTSPGGC